MMGVIYYVACTECKEYRDLDKFYTAGGNIDNRKDMLEHEEYVKTKSVYRHLLLTSFMEKHDGHKCVFFNEHDEPWEEKVVYPEEGAVGYKEDKGFW